MTGACGAQKRENRVFTGDRGVVSAGYGATNEYGMIPQMEKRGEELPSRRNNYYKDYSY